MQVWRWDIYTYIKYVPSIVAAARQYAVNLIMGLYKVTALVNLRTPS